MFIKTEIGNTMDGDLLFDTCTSNLATLLILRIGSDHFVHSEYLDLKANLHRATRSALELDGPGLLKTVQLYLPQLSSPGVSRLFAPTIERVVRGQNRVFMSRLRKIFLLSLMEEFATEYPRLPDFWAKHAGNGEVSEEVAAIIRAENDEVLGKHQAIVTSVLPRNTYMLVGTWIPDIEWLVFGRLKDAAALNNFNRAIQGNKQSKRRRSNLPEPLGKKVKVAVMREQFETPFGTKGTRDRIAAFHPVN